jgi:ubiquinone/menaquinone biosynthesis C-methylase UbiE/ketosteroid isomerase-like protein
MKTENLREEIEALLNSWNRSIIDRDVVTAAQLREDGYSSVLPDGAVLTKEEELELIASPRYVVESIRTQSLKVEGQENAATAVLENLIEGEYSGQKFKALYKYTISLRKTDDRWRASSSRLDIEEPTQHRWNGDDSGESSRRPQAVSFTLSNLVPQPVKSWLKRKIRAATVQDASLFQQTAYIPFKPGLNFVIPPPQATDFAPASSELPIPPKQLWLGYNYPAHGETHVRKMLEIVYASDFSFKKNDRILDLGCGAGRMIRHLKGLSETCEIWGTDISAEHIYWCKQHLSPPFNFATTTKVPHLPFEDRSFHLIYCGSVFTHIDDLADAWLLELKRILAPGGRVYLTIHDNHTIEMFERGQYHDNEIIRRTRSDETYRQAKDSFGMFTVGRDNDSQVFYDTGYFSKTLRSIFDIISVTQEAYFYQTAFLLKRRSQDGD